MDSSHTGNIDNIVISETAPQCRLPEIGVAPEEYRAYLFEFGRRRNTGAIFRKNGYILAILSYDGHCRGAEHIISSLETGDFAENFNRLEDMGLRPSVYAKGMGPTEAEVFEMRFAEKYDDYVERCYLAYQQKCNGHDIHSDALYSDHMVQALQALRDYAKGRKPSE